MEIVGENRSIKQVLSLVDSVCNDSDNINVNFQAHIPAKRTKKSKNNIIKIVDSFTIQIDKSDKNTIEKKLSKYGIVTEVTFYNSPSLSVKLNNPIELNLELKYFMDK
mgnify:CR=1 FL=1|jgi:hypothetical protein